MPERREGQLTEARCILAQRRLETATHRRASGCTPPHLADGPHAMPAQPSRYQALQRLEEEITRLEIKTLQLDTVAIPPYAHW